jgi:exonuclease III
MSNSFSFISSNVRGLGDSRKCDIVKDTLLNNCFDIVLLQETKLSAISQFKSSTFLPSSLQNFISFDASNASGGILTAWNSSKLKLISITKPFSISTKFESESNGSIFWVTNIYGPNDEESRPGFFQELSSLTGQIQGCWLLTGDFNSVRSPLDFWGSTLNMAPNENVFNDMIWELALQEIPLLDHEFTWSNMQNPPILSKLDRVLINSGWNDSFPNSVVTTLPRITSDHYPIKIEVSTNIPRAQVFRYYNNWPLKHGFRELVASVWSSTPPKSDAIGTLVARVKFLRQKANSWKKSLKPDRVHLNNAKRALDLMDWIEELRTLLNLESIFRNLLKKKIAYLINLIAIAARQIGKVTWCSLGDEDSHFHHSRASARLRSNQIKIVESGGSCFFTHKEKERVLTLLPGNPWKGPPCSSSH